VPHLVVTGVVVDLLMVDGDVEECTSLYALLDIGSNKQSPMVRTVKR